MMPGREYQAQPYRFGFNGKENDNDVKGFGSQLDYGFRIYDPRIGRFLSTDPLTKSYPWYTPYQYAGNQPIWAVDIDGLEEWVVTRWYDQDGNVAKLRIFTVVETKNPNKHLNLHFRKGNTEMAQGKKVLYLSLVDGSNKVFKSPTFGNRLTTEENNIYNSKKKSLSLRGFDHWTLEPTYKDVKTNSFENLADNYTEYNAYEQFKIPEPEKPKQPKNDAVKQIPPASRTPDPDDFCFACFNRTTPRSGVHYKRGAQDIQQWLKTNPDYNLEISVDGGGSSLIFMDDWNDEYKDQKTYEQHTRAQFKLLQQEINRLGGDGNRLILKMLEAEGETIRYKPIKKE